MWLLPLFSWLARIAARVYYRDQNNALITNL